MKKKLVILKRTNVSRKEYRLKFIVKNFYCSAGQNSGSEETGPQGQIQDSFLKQSIKNLYYLFQAPYYRPPLVGTTKVVVPLILGGPH